MKDDRLLLVHLSDIHFKDELNGTVYDLDEDLRNELDLDAHKVMGKLGNVHGILITGDIAFSGQSPDYDKAVDWLVKLCDILGCPPENVWTVPGNHDADRSAVEKSPTLQMYHKDLRCKEPKDVNEQIMRLCREDEDAKRALYRPLEGYNEFASRFNCEINAEEPYWEDDLPLNDGSVLRLRGMNSVLVSDGLDDMGENKLLVGMHQYTLSRKPGLVYLTLCHHPPQWLLDADAIESSLNARSHLQLFGHKHCQKVNQIDGNVRITAGAVHPNRRKPSWRPRYNYFVMSVEGKDENRHLNLLINPRVWDDKTKCFVGEYGEDEKDFKPFLLPLGEWNTPDLSSQAGGDNAYVQTENTVKVEDPIMEKSRREAGRIVNPARTLTYRFLSLSYVSRIEIAQSLGLLQDEDKNVKDGELFTRFFRRANERDILEKLWDEVESRHANGRYSENPSENPFAQNYI